MMCPDYRKKDMFTTTSPEDVYLWTSKKTSVHLESSMGQNFVAALGWELKMFQSWDLKWTPFSTPVQMMILVRCTNAEHHVWFSVLYICRMQWTIITQAIGYLSPALMRAFVYQWNNISSIWMDQEKGGQSLMHALRMPITLMHLIQSWCTCTLYTIGFWTSQLWQSSLKVLL